MQKSENLGMQTFDSALYHLVETGKISMDEALKNSDSPNNLRLKFNLNSHQPEKTPASVSLSLLEEEDHEDDADDTAAVQI
jgi:twitching motility protein PilU